MSLLHHREQGVTVLGRAVDLPAVDAWIVDDDGAGVRGRVTDVVRVTVTPFPVACPVMVNGYVPPAT